MNPDNAPKHRFPDHRRRWPRGAPWQKRPGAVFFRLLFSFGFLAVLAVVLFGVPFLLFRPSVIGPSQSQTLIRSVVCLSSLIVFSMMFFAGRRSFRRIASPLSDIMDAADAVAEGDLSTRVSETGSHSFRQLTRSFNRMTEELEQADEKRRNLTADVAHELRNPLHLIQGNLEGVLDGVYEPTEEHIRSTLDETRLLSRLVDDLQTLSLAEAGQLRLKLEPVRLTELLEDVRTSFSGQAENLQIKLSIAIGDRAQQAIVTADYERLQQVLGNLVANALRYTPEGGQIQLILQHIDSQARIMVRDNGQGIPADALPHIFDRFWKGDKARTRRPGSGSGLGLAIARQLIRAHGGTIKATSAESDGTQFTIDLPVTKVTT